MTFYGKWNFKVEQYGTHKNLYRKLIQNLMYTFEDIYEGYIAVHNEIYNYGDIMDEVLSPEVIFTLCIFWISVIWIPMDLCFTYMRTCTEDILWCIMDIHI